MTVRELRPDEVVLQTGARPGHQVRELRSDESVTPAPDPTAQLGRGLNVGIAEGFGAPVDIVNTILGGGSDEPFGGSRSLQRGFETMGITPTPGLTEQLGAPVDAINYLLGLIGGSDEPFGGSRSIQRGFAALGIAPPPEQPDAD
jgi:hypothetical protein